MRLPAAALDTGVSLCPMPHYTVDPSFAHSAMIRDLHRALPRLPISVRCIGYAIADHTPIRGIMPPRSISPAADYPTAAASSHEIPPGLLAYSAPMHSFLGRRLYVDRLKFHTTMQCHLARRLPVCPGSPSAWDCTSRRRCSGRSRLSPRRSRHATGSSSSSTTTTWRLRGWC